MSHRDHMPPSIEDYLARAPAEGRVIGGRDLLRNRMADRSGRVSVITVTFNSVKTIDRTIDSIAGQIYPNVEYIVVDGGSADGTVDRLRAHSGDIDLWISEPDRGISDAFNKGIALAAGEYIALVNSDDWLDSRHLSNAVEELRRTGADFVFGDLMLHATDGRPAHVLRGEKSYGKRLAYAMPHINHPTVVCRRALYEVHGLFEVTLSSAMDYEWFLRGFSKGVRGVYTSALIGHMSLEGASDRNFSRSLQEVCDVSIRYGYPAALARLRYMIRCAKRTSRDVLQHWLPKRMYEWLRHRFNVHYKSVGTGPT